MYSMYTKLHTLIQSFDVTAVLMFPNPLPVYVCAALSLCSTTTAGHGGLEEKKVWATGSL